MREDYAIRISGISKSFGDRKLFDQFKLNIRMNVAYIFTDGSPASLIARFGNG